MQGASDTLPASVEAVIAGLSIVVRQRDQAGPDRILVSSLGGLETACWRYRGDQTLMRLAQAFPALSERQLQTACRAISQRVEVALILSGQPFVRSRAQVGR